MITFPHSALRTTIFFGFSKLIFWGSKFFTNKHLFFITTVKPKAKIPSSIKKIKFIRDKLKEIDNTFIF